MSAAANAVADTLENKVAFEASIFSHKDPKFWCKEVSWIYAKRIFGYKIDMWHLVESLQVLILIAIPGIALIAAIRFIYLNQGGYSIISGLGTFILSCLLGGLYNVVFNFTYKRLKRKPNGN